MVEYAKKVCIDFKFIRVDLYLVDSNVLYVKEDVPQRLVLMESFGKALNLPTSVYTSLIQIANAALSTDFRLEDRTLEK